ncbi:MAG TPA: hypothetical protein VIL48_17190 [Acidimicrobiales bacterium]
MLDHAAPSALAPAGSDLRVVADVRMVTPGRRVAALRVAMRVKVTERDEDIRSIARAVSQAVRTLVLVALLVAAMAAGSAAHRSVAPDVLAGGVTDRVACAAGTCAHASAAAPPLVVGAVPAAVLVLVLVVAAGLGARVVPESDRLPRPALADSVLPSPD